MKTDFCTNFGGEITINTQCVTQVILPMAGIQIKQRLISDLSMTKSRLSAKC